MVSNRYTSKKRHQPVKPCKKPPKKPPPPVPPPPPPAVWMQLHGNYEYFDADYEIDAIDIEHEISPVTDLEYEETWEQDGVSVLVHVDVAADLQTLTMIVAITDAPNTTTGHWDDRSTIDQPDLDLADADYYTPDDVSMEAELEFVPL